MWNGNVGFEALARWVADQFAGWVFEAVVILVAQALWKVLVAGVKEWFFQFRLEVLVACLMIKERFRRAKERVGWWVGVGRVVGRRLFRLLQRNPWRAGGSRDGVGPLRFVSLCAA